MAVRTARMSGIICRLKWGVINNSNNGKKNQGKILEIKYNKVKWAGALAMADLTGSDYKDSCRSYTSRKTLWNNFWDSREEALRFQVH